MFGANRDQVEIKPLRGVGWECAQLLLQPGHAEAVPLNEGAGIWIIGDCVILAHQLNESTLLPAGGFVLALCALAH
jgi:hypothetical protein